MITFYRILSESPNIRKISLMFELLDVPHEVEVIDAHHEEKANSEFKAINPNGTVPAIHDKETGAVIFESGAILYYLAEKTGRLIPGKLKQRGEVIKWVLFEAANVCPAIVELHHYILTDSGDTPEFIFQRYKDKIIAYCDILENQLAGRSTICDELSIADIALFPWTVTFEDMADIKLEDYPNISHWISCLENIIKQAASH